VVAVLLTKETAEMMRSQKRKDVAAAATAKSASAPASSSSAISIDMSSSGTPPLAHSPVRRPSLARQKKKKRNEQHQPQVQVQIINHATPSRSSRPSSSLPFPSPMLPSPISLPSPIRQHNHHQHHSGPNPSFGEEDYGILAGCIENMGSMGSLESVDLVNGIVDNNKESNYNYMSAEKVEAASRAAAAVLKSDNHKHAAMASATNTEAASRLLETTARDIMAGGDGSNESIVISSPSTGHSQGQLSTMSHPHSPESFLMGDSLLDDPKTNLSRSYEDLGRSHSFAITPGAMSNINNTAATSYNYNQGCNPSPTSLGLDWGYDTNMDHFFDDMNGSITPGGPAGLKRKCDVLGSAGSADDGKDHNQDENKRSRLLYNNDSFISHFASDAPIASFGVGVFGSLSNSSNDLPENNHGMASTNKKQSLHPPVKTTLLTPRNRLTSLQQRRSPLPPQAPQLSDDDGELGVLLPSTFTRTMPNMNITNEHSHPSKGTLEQYDDTLYHQLKNTVPPTHHGNVTLPPLLVPRYRTGNRLATIRGSSKQHSDIKVDECVSFKTYEFYKYLREIYPALERCTYLLPGLQSKKKEMWNKSSSLEEEDLGGCMINMSSLGSIRLGHVPGMAMMDKSKVAKSDMKIAKQRVECAIYAFGGTVTRKQQQPLQSQLQPNKSDKMSIFRTRKQDSSTNASSSAKSTSSSSRGGSDSNKKKNKQQLVRSNSLARREKYAKKLRQQYFEHGNRLSWDVQANLSLTLNGAKTFEDDDQLRKSGSNLSSDGKQQQRKNRCKKCGQIKQGHVCPYTSSLQRNIGVMVYPSANAHVADEPGMLATALCEMNNFISIKSGSFENNHSADNRQTTMPEPTKSLIVGDTNELPKKLMSNDGATNQIHPFRRNTLLAPATITCKPIDDKRSDEEEGREDKTEVDQSGGGGEDLLFQPKMEITLDQYRTVTPKDASITKRNFIYPQVPLTFTQRKSMSDALFSLSNMVPKLTDECALVLTEARKRDEWDLAVAELLTQVICVLHCSPSKDYKLEGLRRYLLTLGIVC